jgi:hypothetical protein
MPDKKIDPIVPTEPTEVESVPEYSPKDERKLIDHMEMLRLAVSEAWESKDPSKILTARKWAEMFATMAGEVRKSFDDLFDVHEKGIEGADFVAKNEIVRIRVKSDKVGRPRKAPVDKYADLR